MPKAPRSQGRKAKAPVLKSNEAAALASIWKELEEIDAMGDTVEAAIVGIRCDMAKLRRKTKN
jgi:hypothetical protein